MRAVITIREIDKQEPGYVHFISNDGKAWNCNKQEILGELAVGERYYIDYAETEPKAGRKYGAKYVNRARNWKPEDGPNTWPDKEPYTGGATSSSGGTVKKNDYDPEIGRRQTAANVSGPITLGIIASVPEAERFDAFAMTFPTVADIVFKWIDDKGSLAIVADIGGKTDAGGDEDIPF